MTNPGDSGNLLVEGLGFLRHGNLDLAEAAFRQVVTDDPRNAWGWSHLGGVLLRRNKPETALACLDRAVEIDPDNALLHYNRGGILDALGRTPEALAAFRNAAQRDAGHVEIWRQLALALYKSGQPEEAAAAAVRAADLAPRRADILNLAGQILRQVNLLGAAATALQRALSLAPDLADAWHGLGLTRLMEGRPEEALQTLSRAALAGGDDAVRHSNRVAALNYLPGVTTEEILTESLGWAARQTLEITPLPPLSTSPQGPLRVGYLSPDLYRHPVASFFAPLLAHHDPAVVETHVYSCVARPDAETERLKPMAAHWRDVRGLNDDDLAGAIRADGIQILVDLAGHTQGNRLPMLARRPAPIQVTWLGYPATTGLDAVGYRLTDAVADPPGASDRWHVERLVRLPGFLCYEPPPEAPEPALRRPDPGRIVFGSFNNTAKVHDGVAALWARLLRAVPGSELLLKYRHLRCPDLQRRYRDLFQSHGVSGDRIRLQGHLPSAGEHFALYNEVDIALDPFPYNGTTTTCEALWMGVPVISLIGDRHAGRVGASILTRVGLEELLADNEDHYLAVAVRLASDPDRLARLREGLRERLRRSPLCDADGFAQSVESVYRELWREYAIRGQAGDGS